MKLGFSHDIAKRLTSDTAVHFKIEHVSRICEAINCTPNDLMYYSEDNSQPLSEGHELYKLTKDRFADDLFKNLPLDKLLELRSYAERLKKDEE